MDRITKFIGWGQYTSDEFAKISPRKKAGRLSFVRTLDESGNTKHAEIYFGNRLYAEINDDTKSNKKIENLIKALGVMIDENGNFVSFDITEHAILGKNVTNVTEALVALEKAISTEISKHSDIEQRLLDIEGRLTISGDDIDEVNEEEIEEER